MHAFKALIFDVDGTLAETERDGHRVAFNAAFAEAGLTWHWEPEHYRRLLAVTGGKERIAHFMEEDGLEAPPGRERADFIAGLHRAKTAHYVELLARGAIAPRPGVLRLLGEARAAGIRLAIATTTTPENVTALLDQWTPPDGRGGHLSDWFEVIAAGDVVPNKKPAPDIYVLALERLGLTPDEAVAIEDSDNGVRAALAAGLRALVVTLNEDTRDQDVSAAPLVLDGLGEPDAPPRVVQGTLGASCCLDLAALDALCRALGTAGAEQ
ncbi:MAG: HAD-IA family hydrolase [Chromatiaceae bacterium]|nr:HAD-IA family hydrolase [Chromatiaceae bacterium]